MRVTERHLDIGGEIIISCMSFTIWVALFTLIASLFLEAVTYFHVGLATLLHMSTWLLAWVFSSWADKHSPSDY